MERSHESRSLVTPSYLHFITLQMTNKTLFLWDFLFLQLRQATFLHLKTAINTATVLHAAAVCHFGWGGEVTTSLETGWIITQATSFQQQPPMQALQRY